MKWFKHMTDSSQDEFVLELEDKFGIQGYAWWWKMLEAIAAQMSHYKGAEKCSLASSLANWESILKGKRKKLISFFEHCEKLNRIKLERNGNLLIITCPKLLEIKDNYQKDLEVSSKTERRKKKEEKESLSQESSLKKTASKPSTNPDVKMAIGHYSDEYLRIHGTRPHVNGAACKTFQTLLNTKPIEQVNTLTTGYLSLADEKLRDKGFPIEWMPNHINSLLLAEKKPDRGFVY
jgi:hypothetical protein